MPKSIIQWSWISFAPTVIGAGNTVSVHQGGNKLNVALGSTVVDVSRHPNFAFSLYSDVPVTVTVQGGQSTLVASFRNLFAVAFGALAVQVTPNLPAPFNLQESIVLPYPFIRIRLTVAGVVADTEVQFYGVAYD
jgi:hypothetical protein